MFWCTQCGKEIEVYFDGGLCHDCTIDFWTRYNRSNNKEGSLMKTKIGLDEMKEYKKQGLGLERIVMNMIDCDFIEARALLSVISHYHKTLPKVGADLFALMAIGFEQDYAESLLKRWDEKEQREYEEFCKRWENNEA
jgi:hypothetical protein